MRYLASFLVVAALLGGCGFEKFQDQTNAAAVELGEKVGVKPFPAWKSQNGVLVEVTFVFEAGDIARYSIGELEALAREAAARHIDPPPQRVNVSIHRGNSRPPPPGTTNT